MPLSLRVTDVSDREILRVIFDEADDEGWADLEDIANRFFSMRGEDRRRSAMRSCATRLAYMKRTLNVVKKRVMVDKIEHREYTQWALTAQGHHFLNGQLTASQQSSLSSADDGKLVAATEIISNRYMTVKAPVATMIRRQFQYGYGHRRR